MPLLEYYLAILNLPFRTKCCSEAGNLCLPMTRAKLWRMYQSTPSMGEIFSEIAPGESVQLFHRNFTQMSSRGLAFIGRVVCMCLSRPEKMVWHGSSSKGQRQTDQYCETWRAGDRAVTGLASSLKSGYLLQQSASSCSGSYIVLCIENAFTSHSKK